VRGNLDSVCGVALTIIFMRAASSIFSQGRIKNIFV
jgi:hypothetical protein